MFERCWVFGRIISCKGALQPICQDPTTKAFIPHPSALSAPVSKQQNSTWHNRPQGQGALHMAKLFPWGHVPCTRTFSTDERKKIHHTWNSWSVPLKRVDCLDHFSDHLSLSKTAQVPSGPMVAEKGRAKMQGNTTTTDSLKSEHHRLVVGSLSVFTSVVSTWLGSEGKSETLKA